MEKRLVARGMGASPGTATGHAVFRSEDAVRAAAKGLPIILVRMETSAEDVPAIQASAGIVTTHGGLTGDAAIIARTLGKPCIAGCGALRVDYGRDEMIVQGEEGAPDVVVPAGQMLSIDGARGEIWVHETAARA